MATVTATTLPALLMDVDATAASGSAASRMKPSRLAMSNCAARLQRL
jgi:hypothetical protein